MSYLVPSLLAACVPGQAPVVHAAPQVRDTLSEETSGQKAGQQGVKAPGSGHR